MDWATQSDDLAALLAQETASAATTNSSAPSAETLIVHTLEQRSLVRRSYTYIGSNVLLSLGPTTANNNNNTNNGYTSPVNGDARTLPAQYQRAAEAALSSTDDDALALLPPHTMQLASTVFCQMLMLQENQSVIFCGVSGAGQSIDRRIFSQQLVDMSNNGKKKSKILSGAVKMEYALDSFGLAKSLHAVDASCYGRYTEYQFSSTGRMVGIKLMDYALDSARVTAGSSLQEGERTFNIFYQLLAGASKSEKETLHISDPSSFAYLKGTKLVRAPTISRSGTLSRRIATLGRSGTTSKKDNATPATASPSATAAGSSSSSEDAIPTAKDAQNFSELRENLNFATDPNLKDDESTVIRNPESLDIAATLLGLGSKSLADSLMYRSKHVGRELCSIYLQPEGAALQRDALAETLYSLLFAWLVEHLNTRLCKSDEDVDSFIGLVDFPGFRSQYAGSATQFPIFIGNYVQERLVQYTQNCYYDDVDFIFKTDGLAMSVPSYQDNQWTVDVFRGTRRQKGLLALLDDEPETGDDPDSDLNRNQNLLTHIDNGLKSNPHYIASFQCSSVGVVGTSVSAVVPAVKNMFGIRHYNAESVVQYDLDSFLDQDIRMSDFVALFRGSAGLISPEGETSVNETDVTFISGLFSNRTGVRTIRSGRGALLGVQKSQGPLRKPSVKRKKKLSPGTTPEPTEEREVKDNASAVHHNQKMSQFSTAGEMIDELLDTLKSTRHELCQFRAARDVDASHGIKYSVFSEKYSSLLATKGFSHSAGTPRDLVKQFVTAQYWSAREVALGNTMLFLSLGRWRWIQAAMKRLESSDGKDGTMAAEFRPTSMLSTGTAITNHPGIQPWMTTRQTSALTDDDRSDIESNYESEYGYNDNDGRISGKSPDVELGNLSSSKAVPSALPFLETNERLWIVLRQSRD
ncbi:hypothetical protein BASA81_017280 [Batrachochytrium salamandrivorans]|nr:hypothetical protein BASA81_017280 [Batrachochytrium salamandrivorans]